MPAREWQRREVGVVKMTLRVFGAGALLHGRFGIGGVGRGARVAAGARDTATVFVQMFELPLEAVPPP